MWYFFSYIFDRKAMLRILFEKYQGQTISIDSTKKLFKYE